MLSGIQPAGRERRKAKNRQLRDSNPGCLTKAAINHRATKPPQKPASTILLSYCTGGTANCSLTPARPHELRGFTRGDELLLLKPSRLGIVVKIANEVSNNSSLVKNINNH